MRLTTLLFLSLYELTVAQVSTVNGVAQYAGTPVQQNPNGIPTLVYNCAKLPAICQNVNRRNPLTPRTTGFGALRGVGHVELHYDTNAGRIDSRRNVACPSNWKTTHACPEANQPETVPAGSRLGLRSYPARRYVDPNRPVPLVMGDPGYNAIANPAGGHSGMIWTCDEWPPATAVEGGAGANSICAPHNGACGGSLPQGVGGVNSEQNFQSNAHGLLRNRVGPTANAAGVFRFHFRTTWYDGADEAATEVVWYLPNSDFVTPYQKRSGAEPLSTYRVVERFYANGTTSQTTQLIKRRQVEDDTGGQSSNMSTPVAAGHQGFEFLDQPPLLPFIDIAREFMTDREGSDGVTYIQKAIESSTLNKTNPYNISTSGGPGRRDLSIRSPANLHVRDRHGVKSLSSSSLLVSRADKQCDESSPCPDGSCCNKDGRCGYGPELCGDDVCVSNCDATALCGRDSLGGSVKCPLNVCCGYYGYCGVGTEFCVGTSDTAKCQQGFGSCQTVSPPTCGGNSASGRTIGYYQVANVRERQCNRISPSQIKTDGLTHVNLAFASIDPASLKVVPGNAADVEIYKQFTALKSSKLQTWIAIGGWDLSDPGPTRTAFNDVALSASSRATFISSLIAFMDQHGFQGVDIDWEYPGAPDRGGKPQDTDNYVALVREMRAAFGTKYGISMAIPSSYWYLRWFKPKQMEPYVDWFGIMTYDLHGPWDKDVKQIGTVVLGHTNIPEIANWTQPLWYDGVNPAKVNMGLAYYSRGYTVSDPNCNAVGCQWKGPSRPGQCTNFGGVHSLQEIQRLIAQLGIQPKLLAADMMKQLTFGDQWIGYDDTETIAMKRQWASSHCFGGTMIWSVDMFSGSGSGDVPDGNGSTDPSNPGGGQGDGSGLIYIDPSIYDKTSPEVNCRPPCTLILPPKSFSKATTITFPPYVTSLDVAWSESTGWTSIVQTTTITIPPVTTTEIEVWAYTVSDTRTTSGAYSTFRITPSIRPSPFTIKDDPNPLKKSGVSHPVVTRTITPPPWPYTYTPPGGGRPTSTSTSTDIVPVVFPIVTWKPGPPGPICKSKCGRPCLLFCDHPCLLDCTDGGNDFPDPINPKPPPRPKPTPKPEVHPSGTPTKVSVPPDPKGTDPKNEEQEEDDQRCAMEFDLPLPTFRPPESSTSVKPKPSAPTTSPTPPPDPPKPRRDTEEVHCYDSGQFINRGLAIEALEYFCDDFEGVVLDASMPNTRRTLSNNGYGVHCIGEHGSIGGCFVDVQISVTVKNGCKFKMEGKGANEECGRILRRIIDQCDTTSTEFKQGGTLESNCANWRFDPNNRW